MCVESHPPLTKLCMAILGVVKLRMSESVLLRRRGEQNTLANLDPPTEAIAHEQNSSPVLVGVAH
jgi:hypothetical protein